MKFMVSLSMIAAAVFGAVLLANFGAASAAGEASQATGTVSAYLEALMVGDVARARVYLTPRLAKERQALLNNPGYPETLRQAYSGASVEIVDSRVVEPNKVEVDVQVTLDGSDRLFSRFVLTRTNDDYFIDEER